MRWWLRCPLLAPLPLRPRAVCRQACLRRWCHSATDGHVAEPEPVMDNFEPIGYLAALLVLATFCMRDMVSLRVLAIASNLAFLGYAALAGIHPVLMLHALLLPMNVWRLVEATKRRDAAQKPHCLQTSSPGDPS